jgi:hypothetical protein
LGLCRSAAKKAGLSSTLNAGVAVTTNPRKRQAAIIFFINDLLGVKVAISALVF